MHYLSQILTQSLVSTHDQRHFSFLQAENKSSQYFCFYWTNRWQKRRFDPCRLLRSSGSVTLFRVTEKRPPLVCGDKNQNPISEHRSELHQHNVPVAASGETWTCLLSAVSASAAMIVPVRKARVFPLSPIFIAVFVSLDPHLSIKC